MGLEPVIRAPMKLVGPGMLRFAPTATVVALQESGHWSPPSLPVLGWGVPWPCRARPAGFLPCWKPVGVPGRSQVWRGRAGPSRHHACFFPPRGGAGLGCRESDRGHVGRELGVRCRFCRGQVFPRGRLLLLLDLKMCVRSS